MKSVLITRPVELATVLANKVKEKNYRPMIFPAVEIKPLDFDHNINFNQYSSVVFISPAAIIHFSKHIKTLPSHLKIFTIGEDSAALIHKLGWSTPLYPPLHFNRDGLLNMPEMQNISQLPILLVEGTPSHSALSTALQLRGATVTQLFVYERVLPKPLTLPELNSIDIVIATSEQSLENLITLLGEGIKRKTLLVSSQRLADTAKDKGFTAKPILAKNAGDAALIQALPTQS